MPIDIGSDGAFCIAVRADGNAMPGLSVDEKRREVVSWDTFWTTATCQIAPTQTGTL